MSGGGAAEERAEELNYSEVGFTQAGLRGGPLPPGYRHLRVSRRLTGTNFDAVSQALLTWGVHAAAGVRMESKAERAAPGLEVATCLGVGRATIRARCRIAWVEDSENCAAFGYGGLVGHPFAGEEAFQVSRTADGKLWFTVVAYSRADRWFSRLAGPLVPLFQRAYLLWLARAAGRISRTPIAVP